MEPTVVKVPVAGSYSSAEAIGCATNDWLPGADSRLTLPPAIRTLPSGRRVAVWSARASANAPVVVNVPVAGSNSSALDWSRLVAGSMPPTTSTRPSRRVVAVAPQREARIGRGLPYVPVARSYSTAVCMPSVFPPAIITRPSASTVRAGRCRSEAPGICPVGSNRPVGAASRGIMARRRLPTTTAAPTAKITSAASRKAVAMRRAGVERPDAPRSSGPTPRNRDRPRRRCRVAREPAMMA